VNNTPIADLIFSGVSFRSRCRYDATPKSLKMCAILTKTTVIENIPISLGVSNRARKILTKNCTPVAPEVDKKLIINERLRLGIAIDQ
jgi:hypothetical protein